jgi:hypothetical protein
MSWFGNETVGDTGGRAATLKNIAGQQRGLYDTSFRPAEAEYVQSLQRDDRAQMEQRARSDYFQSMNDPNALNLAAGRGFRPNNQGAALSNVTTNARLGADQKQLGGISDAANLSLGILTDSQKAFSQSALANNQMLIEKANLANRTNASVQDSMLTGLGTAYGGWERLNERDWIQREAAKRRQQGAFFTGQQSDVPGYTSRLGRWGNDVSDWWRKL